MARTRKSVLGENPFDTGKDSASTQRGKGREKEPSRRKSEKSTAKKPKAATVSKAKGNKAKPKAKPKASKAKPTKVRAAKAKAAKAATPKAAAPKPKAAKAKVPKAKTSKTQAKTNETAKAKSAKAPREKVEPTRFDTPKAPDDGVDVAAVQSDTSLTKVTEVPPPVDDVANDAKKRRIAQAIRDLESRLDEPDRNVQGRERRRAERGSAAASASLEMPGGEGGMFDAARELLSSDYYLRQWGRLGMRGRSEEVDDFGHDRKYDARFRPLFDVLHERYFRVDIEGIENVPADGRTLIVANHAGTFPFDGVMLKTALRRHHPQARELRWLAEDHLFYMPFVGSFLNRMGAVRACQENAERLLRQERLVAVFPEGAKGTGRLYRNRRKLQRFGRGGFVRLCLRTQTPIVPCVILGAEESMPLLFRIEYLANLLGLPYIPVTPTFPLLGPLGVVPAPTKWYFRFGEPIHFEQYGVGAAEDHVLVRRLTERVRATMQGLLDQVASSRRSVWFG